MTLHPRKRAPDNLLQALRKTLKGPSPSPPQRPRKRALPRPDSQSRSASEPSDPNGPTIVIRGVGQVSALGQSAWETFRSLLAGRTISDRLAELPAGVDLVSQVMATGGVKAVQHTATDPAVDLAERAAREALQDAGYAPNDPFTGPVFLGTSKGAVTAWTVAGLPGNLANPNLRPTDAALAGVLGPHGYLAHHLGQRLKTPIGRNLVAACASSLVALDAARRHLLHSNDQRALVITAESALLPLFVHTYRRLGVLCPPDRYVAKPFAPEQHGFTLGEQAAAVVLQKHPVEARSPIGHARLLATATANDPHDLIRTNPDGEAIRQVARAVLNGRPCQALLAHAPGTRVHEQVELEAVQEIQGDLPPVYGLKGAIGHGLGASGLMSLVTACLCLRAKRLPPMPWLQDQTPTVPSAAPAGQPLPADAKIAVLAAGFAGHTAGALIGPA